MVTCYVPSTYSETRNEGALPDQMLQLEWVYPFYITQSSKSLFRHTIIFFLRYPFQFLSQYLLNIFIHGPVSVAKI